MYTMCMIVLLPEPVGLLTVLSPSPGMTEPFPPSSGSPFPSSGSSLHLGSVAFSGQSSETSSCKEVHEYDQIYRYLFER